MRPGERRLATRQGSGLFLFMGAAERKKEGHSGERLFRGEEGDAGGGVFLGGFFRIAILKAAEKDQFSLFEQRRLPAEKRKTAQCHIDVINKRSLTKGSGNPFL